VNAFYATQQIFNKAYGNYLGIARLGAFMAHEMNIPLQAVNIFVGIAKLGDVKKRDPKLATLASKLRSHMTSVARAA